MQVHARAFLNDAGNDRSSRNLNGVLGSVHRDPESIPSCHLFATLQIELGPPIGCGVSAKGQRRVVPIVGGTFFGPHCAGRVLSGGTDWQMVLNDGVVELDAR